MTTSSAALIAWDLAVRAYRARVTDDGDYRASLAVLDACWRDAGLPLPWYPGMIAVGVAEVRQ